jgi:DNA-cytosine methyltransferase
MDRDSNSFISNSSICPVRVLSLFDGISCGKVALDRLGIKTIQYFASEIDREAIKVSLDNHLGEITQIGDVTKIKGENLPKIDLMIGGSPCQGFSIAGKKLNFEDPRSALFFEYVRLLKETKPTYFLLENVRMDKEIQDKITEILQEVYPETKVYNFNSKLVSAQLRNRFYWTNIPNIVPPPDRKIMLKDILESGVVDREKARAILESESRPLVNPEKMLRRYIQTGFTTIVYDSEKTMLRVREATKKGYTDIATGEGVDLNFPNSKTRAGRAMRDKVHTLMSHSHEYFLFEGESIRYFTQTELERLQTLPDGYTKILPRNKAAGVIGNGWTVDMIAHILSHMNL